MISMIYYIAKRRRRYFISWDTSKTEKMIYIYIYEDWERDNPIWDWQFQDINEILCRQKKKPIFHIMRYVQNSKTDLYIYIWNWRLRERQTNTRLAIPWYQWNTISQKKKRRYFISWDTSKTAKTIYIHINEVRERDNEVWEWQFHDINEILYRQKKSTIFPIMRYTQKRKNDIYIYMIIKIERDTIKFEIGNFIILMKYYIVTKRRRYFIWWDTFKKNKNDLYIHIWKWGLRERQTNVRLAISWY